MKSRILVVLVALLAALGVACDPWANSPEPTHYELIGGHAVATCSSCHPTDEIAPAPTDCESCHADDKPVDHYDGQCADCHTPLGWSQFLHDFFPLKNAHELECAACHDEGDFTGLSTACESCHFDDVPANHFDGACEVCHIPTVWEDGDIDHSKYFPIPHEGNGACLDCHTTGSNLAFECIECHEHRKSAMDNEHQGEVNNYRWESSACLGCHPKGKE